MKNMRIVCFVLLIWCLMIPFGIAEANGVPEVNAIVTVEEGNEIEKTVVEDETANELFIEADDTVIAGKKLKLSVMLNGETLSHNDVKWKIVSESGKRWVRLLLRR